MKFVEVGRWHTSAELIGPGLTDGSAGKGGQLGRYNS